MTRGERRRRPTAEQAKKKQHNNSLRYQQAGLQTDYEPLRLLLLQVKHTKPRGGHPAGFGTHFLKRLSGTLNPFSNILL